MRWFIYTFHAALYSGYQTCRQEMYTCVGLYIRSMWLCTVDIRHVGRRCTHMRWFIYTFHVALYSGYQTCRQ